MADGQRIPGSWETVRLGDLVDAGKLLVQSGFAQGGFNEEGVGVPHMRPFNVNESGEVDLTQVKSVEPPSGDRPCWLQPGDVLFNNTNSEDLVGKTAYWSQVGRYTLSNHMTLIRSLTPDTVDGYWLARLLHYLWQSKVFKGLCRRYVGQASISQDRLRTLELQLPPLPEQHAIARVLRAVQAAREARQREVSLERERKAALMAHLFTCGTRGEPTKQTPIGEMPESWEARELGDICEVRYGLGQPPELDENGVPMIRATDIKAGRILSGNVLRVKSEAIPRGRNPFLQTGDIIVVRSGAYTGDVAVYDGRWECALVGYDLVATPRSERVNSIYVASFLLSERGARYFRSQRDRSAQPHLNAMQLRKAVLPVPPTYEQTEIAGLSKACDAQITAVERESALLDELFRALLEELMTGRLAVAG